MRSTLRLALAVLLTIGVLAGVGYSVYTLGATGSTASDSKTDGTGYP